MKLIEALRLVNEGRRKGNPETHFHLLCGFTPLHLETLLAAHLQQRISDRQVVLATGLFGDLAGNIGRAAASPGERSTGAAIVVEWSDLDSRLGWRSTGGWRTAKATDIVNSSAKAMARIIEVTRELASRVPAVAVCLPTLGLPPVSHGPGNLLVAMEADLEGVIADAARELARIGAVRVANARRLATQSPSASRHDVAADLALGFPYSIAHADAVASLLSALLAPPSPKKGLITDLDDTLWRGILGDVGVEGISNSLEGHAQGHGLYQQLLASLADSGVLLAVASKNDADGVRIALAQPERLIGAESFFPVEAHWRPKSESVAAILKAWNVGVDSVVFVDDSPMELAEVKDRHPDLECIRFPANDPAAIAQLLQTLRDLFGKPMLLDEDRLRIESIRSGSALAELEGADSRDIDGFLAAIEAEVTFSIDSRSGDARAFELLNKTNQFNLNGLRYTEAEWQDVVSRPDRHVIVVSYKDKFGPLGRIAVLVVTRDGDILEVASWVLSCRAFSRRVEHQCLEMLFEHFGVSKIRLMFSHTERNAPTRDFLKSFVGEDAPSAPVTLHRDRIRDAMPTLHHTVHIEKGAQ